MKVSLWLAPVVSVVILFGSVGVASLTGAWQTSGRAQVVQGERIGPDDLKGWMTLQQAADGLGVTVGSLITLVGAPAPDLVTPATALKDLEVSVPGFELTAFRERVRAFLAGAPLPSTPVSSTPAPASTAEQAPSPGAGTTAAITGQMTLAQVALASGLDLVELVREAGLPATVDPGVPLKDLQSTVPGFQIQQVRDAVARLS